MRYLDRSPSVYPMSFSSWATLSAKGFTLWLTLSKMYASSSALNKRIWTSKGHLPLMTTMGVGRGVDHKEMPKCSTEDPSSSPSILWLSLRDSGSVLGSAQACRSLFSTPPGPWWCLHTQDIENLWIHPLSLCFSPGERQAGAPIPVCILPSLSDTPIPRSKTDMPLVTPAFLPPLSSIFVASWHSEAEMQTDSLVLHFLKTFLWFRHCKRIFAASHTTTLITGLI